jgi:hypothetical protein
VSYGPYVVGDFVQTYAQAYVERAELLYGVVVKAGPRQLEVCWESGHRSRYRQDYHLDRGDFRYFTPIERAKVVKRLRGEQEHPVHDGLCPSALHGLDYKGQPCGTCGGWSELEREETR